MIDRPHPSPGARQLALLAIVLCAVAGCAAGTPHPSIHGHAMHGMAQPASEEGARPLESTPALALAGLPALRDVLGALEDKRVVYVGETHDKYAHHLTQLEIIKHLHRIDPRLAIGVEFFQQPFQKDLDDYAAGRLDERGMLVATEYFQRWGYDYRLYAPIVRYARDNALPLIALNAPRELIEKVRQTGIAGLSAEDRARLPAEIDRGDADYAERLKEIFEMHAHQGNGRDFDRFLDVQLLWDESMAQRAADFLQENPDHRLVVLAGSGHLAFGSGIPQRLSRRIPVSSAIVLNDWPGPIEPALGDYLLMPDARPLPAPGVIGAMLEGDERGVKVLSCVPGSACESAGLQRGDRLLSLEGVEVADMSAVRALMWDRRPGETVTATVRRERVLLRPEERNLTLELR